MPIESLMSPRPSETIADLIRRYRGDKHWSRMKLGNEVGRSASWIWKVERGEIEVNDVHMLGRLAVVLGVPRVELIEASLGPDTSESCASAPTWNRSASPSPDTQSLARFIVVRSLPPRLSR